MPLGQPVVLIHGWPLSGKSWEAQVGPLVEAGFRVTSYDRRGFGNSCRPWKGYNYDVMAQDLDDLLKELNLQDAALVGFSMGGGELARYVGKYGTKRIAKAVFAAAVPPYLFKTEDNPERAVTQKDLDEKQSGVKKGRQAFLEEFKQKFFTSKGGKLAVSEDQRLFAKAIASTASPKGTHDCVEAFSCTDFRGDLAKFNILTLVLHGDSDQTVPFGVSGQRTHKMVKGSRGQGVKGSRGQGVKGSRGQGVKGSRGQGVKGSSLHVIKGGPHGCNVSHPEEFNQALISFLKK